MKKVLSVIVVIVIIVALCFGGAMVQTRIYDDRISVLTSLRDDKQSVVDDMIKTAYHADTQNETDVKYMNGVFDRIFSFYDIDSFKKAKAVAVDYGMPTDFVNSFYDTTELSSMYAEAMLDIICQYSSADFYLLDRSEDIGYYYVTVKLDTVKYSSGRIELGFFIALQDHGADDEKFKSVIYYNIV